MIHRVRRWFARYVDADPAPRFTWRESSVSYLSRTALVPRALAEQILALGVAAVAPAPDADHPDTCSKTSGNSKGALFFFEDDVSEDACAEIVRAWEPTRADVVRLENARSKGLGRQKRRRSGANASGAIECSSCQKTIGPDTTHVLWPCLARTCKACLRAQDFVLQGGALEVGCPCCEMPTCHLPLARVALVFSSVADQPVLHTLFTRAREAGMSAVIVNR